MWKPDAVQINRAMKATIEQLESLGVKFINGTITNVFRTDGFIHFIIVPDDSDDDDAIYIKLSNAELIQYHDCHLLESILEGLKATGPADVELREKVLDEAAKLIRNRFLGKVATVTVQELQAGDAIVQLDGSIYGQEATTDWTKYLLYEWK